MVERITALLGELSGLNPTQSFAILWDGNGRFTGSTGWFCLTWVRQNHSLRRVVPPPFGAMGGGGSSIHPQWPKKRREREIKPNKAMMCDYSAVWKSGKGPMAVGAS